MVRGAFPASLEVTFGRVTEQTAPLQSKEEQGGIFFLSTRCWEAAGLRTAVEFMSWQRKEAEKVLIKVMECMDP